MHACKPTVLFLVEFNSILFLTFIVPKYIDAQIRLPTLLTYLVKSVTKPLQFLSIFHIVTYTEVHLLMSSPPTLAKGLSCSLHNNYI